MSKYNKKRTSSTFGKRFYFEMVFTILSKILGKKQVQFYSANDSEYSSRIRKRRQCMINLKTILYLIFVPDS